MTRKKIRANDTVPREIAELQVDAYRHAFMEAVRRANEAVKQRDYWREQAHEARCRMMSRLGECPDNENDPCPAFFGKKCRKCREIDRKARYL